MAECGTHVAVMRFEACSGEILAMDLRSARMEPYRTRPRLPNSWLEPLRALLRGVMMSLASDNPLIRVPSLRFL